MESVCACLDSRVTHPHFFVRWLIQSLDKVPGAGTLFSHTAGEGGLIFVVLLKPEYK